MATRSTIAFELQDGTVQQIYCHNDGYLEHNGRLLDEQWQDPAKILQLIQLGDLSILGRDIGRKQDFSDRNVGWCLAYGRDRGEQSVEATQFESFDQYTLYADFEEYNYIFRNGRWLVAREDLKFQSLSAELNKIAVESLK
jgi:hypothetical protein